jgi:nucleoside-diphosphate-sugar epimerase
MDNIDKISVFGGSGFIGSKFCSLYSDQIIKLDKTDYKPKTNNILYLISTVDNYNIHQNLHIDIDTNLKVLMNVLENIPKNEDIVFNFVSSWFVYGQNNEIPFREDYSKCNPTGFYSITKYCAEQLLISFCQTFNIKYRIFRLANVLGEGDLKISKKKNALQYLIKQITENKDVELYYGGKVLRDYIYVDDVCTAIKHCIDHAPVNEIINIGSGEPFMFGDLIQKAIDYSGSSSKIIDIQPTQFHNIVQVRHSYLDIKKLKSYGYTNKFSVESVIHKLVDFYKNSDIIENKP